MATEDAVMMLHSILYNRGIDLPTLLESSDLATQLTGTAPGGRSKSWLIRWLAKGNQFQSDRFQDKEIGTLTFDNAFLLDFRKLRFQ